MIRIALSGGLGNQLFQYAAAYTLAKKKKTNLQIDVAEFARYPLRDYMLDIYNLPSSVETTKTIWPLSIQKILPTKQFYAEPYYHYDPEFFNLSDNTIIQGYFQSQKYFKEISDEIHKHLTLKNALSEHSAKIAKDINKTPIAISVHIRRGDYVSDAKTQAVHGCASEEYYQKAIDYVINLYGENVTFFMFSDDAVYVKEAFSHIENKYIVSGNNDVPQEDMALMSTCDHHIIANSSFSWWGAWLNDKKNKTVIAPKNWFSAETLKEKSTRDLFPDDWITL